MEIESSVDTDSPVHFPFLLTTEQATVLSGYTYAQWMVHVNNVRSGYPNPEAEIDAFLQLPRDKIIEGFQQEIARLLQPSIPPDFNPSE